MPLPSRSIDAEQVQSASPIAVESAMIALREAAMSVSPISGVTSIENALLDTTSSLEDSLVSAMDRNPGAIEKLTKEVKKDRRVNPERREENTKVPSDKRKRNRRKDDPSSVPSVSPKTENQNILQFFKSEFDTRFEDVKQRSVDQISNSAFDLKTEFASELGPLGGIAEFGIDFLGGAVKSLAASGLSTLRKTKEDSKSSESESSIQDVTSEFSEKLEETSTSSTDTLNTSIQNVENAVREASPTLEERREAKRRSKATPIMGKTKEKEQSKAGGFASSILSSLGMGRVGGIAARAAGGIAGAAGLSKIAGSVMPSTSPAVQPVMPADSPNPPSKKGSIFKSIGKGLLKGARFIPGVGLALAAGSALASGGMAAYNSIQSGGSIGDAIGNGLQGAASDLTFGLIPSPEVQKESGETVMGQSVSLSTENLDKMSTEELQKLRTSTETLAVMKSNNLSRMTNASTESNDIASAKFYNEQSMKVIDEAQSKISMIDKELSSRSNVESATEQNMKSIEMEVRASTNRGRGSVSGGVGNNVVAPVSNDNRVVNNNTTVVNAPDTDPTIRNLNNNLFGQFAR